MLISETHTQELLTILVRLLYNLAYHIATIFNITYTENRIKGFRAANSNSIFAFFLHPASHAFPQGLKSSGIEAKSLEICPNSELAPEGNYVSPSTWVPFTTLPWCPWELTAGLPKALGKTGSICCSWWICLFQPEDQEYFFWQNEHKPITEEKTCSASSFQTTRLLSAAGSSGYFPGLCSPSLTPFLSFALQGPSVKI